MKVQNINSHAIVVADVKGLDPIMVVFVDYANGSGRIVVQCYGEAWTAWWGAMGAHAGNVQAFIAAVEADYLANSLVGTRRNFTQGEHMYLERIAQVIIGALRKSNDEQVIK